MLFRRFESLIDVFKPSPDIAPPPGMLRFYGHYLKQVWPLMVAVLIVGFFAAVIEVALFSFLGQLIDMAQASTDAGSFFAEHRDALLWMLLVALVIRPLVFGLHNLLTHQAVNPGLTNLIRWQNHRYVLKQSLSFFLRQLGLPPLQVPPILLPAEFKRAGRAGWCKRPVV